MRFLLLGPALASALAVAQPVPGVWGGYVTGWQSTAPVAPVRVFPSPLQRPALAAWQLQQLQAQQWWAWQHFTATQLALAQPPARARSDEPSRAEEAERAALQAELAREQQRSAAQQAALSQQQLQVQQENLRLQQQLLEQERESAEAARRALAEDELARARRKDAEQKLEAEREALRRETARAEEAARPRVKGPDIHRWVDADGVVHYSTRPKR